KGEKNSSSSTIETTRPRMTVPRTHCEQLACVMCQDQRNDHVPGIFRDVFVELLKLLSLLLLAHRDGLVVRTREFLRLPRVLNDAVVQALTVPAKLGEYQLALAPLLRSNIFTTHQSHADRSGGDDASIRDCVPRDQLIESLRLLYELNRHVVNGAFQVSMTP